MGIEKFHDPGKNSGAQKCYMTLEQFQDHE